MVRGRRLLPALLACAALVLSLAWFPSPAPAAAVDVYTTPGEHTINGRQWKTTCEPFGKLERCTTLIWATKTSLVNGRVQQEQTWVHNNLTYKQSSRADWNSWDLLITPGLHDSAGRKWRTQCDTSWTGSGGCRSEIWGTVVEYKDGRWQNVQRWVFNNQVRISPLNCPVTQQQLRSVLSFCNSPQMNAPEAYIQFKPGLISEQGEVTDGSTEEFLRNFMSEFHQFIVRVRTVLPRDALTEAQ